MVEERFFHASAFSPEDRLHGITSKNTSVRASPLTEVRTNEVLLCAYDALRRGDWWMSQAIDKMLGTKLRVLKKVVLCNQ
jgi:hypothetical protein